MPYSNLEHEFSIHPVWRLAFRPFFLAGALFSVVCIALWWAVIQGALSLSLYGGSYWWHAHEMIFGFALAIVVGFLLTAVQNWTGVRSINGKGLLTLFSFWLLARVLIFSNLPAYIVALPDLIFLLYAALAFSLPQIKARQVKNVHIFVPLLIYLAVLNGLSHNAAANYSNALPYFHSAIFVVVFFIVLLGSRVIPFFVGNALKIPQPRPPRIIENLTNISMILLIVLALIGFYQLPPWVVVASAGASLLLHCIKVYYWFDHRVFERAILWSLYAAYGFILLGLLLLVLYGLGLQGNFSLVLHSFSVGGIGGIIIAMAARVSLGHSGRPLVLPTAMPWSLGFIFIAGASRVAIPLVNSEWYLAAIYSSSACWLIAFSIFLYCYTPILLSARADGKPG